MKKALVEWRRLLGEQSVILDPATSAAYGTATYDIEEATAAEPRVAAVLRPGSRDETRRVVEIAHRHRARLYPVSGGRNWGLGSRAPSAAGSVILDLSRLDRILHLDREMATVTVEPGVTFEALAEYLRREAPEWVIDSIGSTGRASLVGNAVERGHGMNRYADRASHVTDLEVILADGQVIRTGFGAMPGSRLAGLCRWGVGPAIDGLFTQSSLGLVASMTLWLLPAPQYFLSFAFGLEDDSRLADLLDRWRHERLNGSRATLRIFNDLRLAAVARAYPFEATGGAVPLPESERARLGGFPGRWIGLGAVSAPSADLADAERRRLEELFGPHSVRLEIYDEQRARQIRAGGDEDEKAWLELVYEKSVLRGFTSERPIRMCYWRKPGGAPEAADLNPDRDRCGVRWYCPAIPATGRDALALYEIVERRSREFGFEPNLGFLSIHERTLDVTGAIIYDREVSGEDDRAAACHDAILEDCRLAGYSPYRLGIGSMDQMAHMQEANRRLLRRIEAVLDPEDILAPGRYTANPQTHAARPAELRSPQPSTRPAWRISVISATDSSTLVERYHEGQLRALRRFAVSGIASSERWRLRNPATRLILLRSGDHILGGVRLDLRRPGFPLPLTEALSAFLDEGQLHQLSEAAGAEIAGLWLDSDDTRRIAGGGAPVDGTFLMIGGLLAAARRLHIGPLIGLAHAKTFGTLWALGFEPITHLGQGGRFPYPDERYVSTLCRFDPRKPKGADPHRDAWFASLAEGHADVPGRPEIAINLSIEVR